MLPRYVLVLLPMVIETIGQMVFVNRTGCGTSTKACLFRPNGCDPNLDCTTAIVMTVTGQNKLFVQMAATALLPPVQQQYIAVAFSKDQLMGDDSVSECVLSDMGQLYGYEPEIFISYNKGKSNDRVFLNTDEQRTLIGDVAADVVDGRIVCEFTQQIVPQIDRKNGLVWSLDQPYYVMVATGSAQPDEVNAHDMNRGSHFYPIVSKEMINPSTLTEINYEPLPETTTTSRAPTTSIRTNRIQNQLDNKINRKATSLTNLAPLALLAMYLFI